MASQLRAAPRGSAAGLGFGGSLTRRPETRDRERLGGDGLDGHVFSVCLTPPLPTVPGEVGQSVNVRPPLAGGNLALKDASSPGPP